MTASQPWPRWTRARPADVSTVEEHDALVAPRGQVAVRGVGAPTSSASSAKMFWSERGTGRTCGCTENDSPIGCPGVGYGSCPTTSTRPRQGARERVEDGRRRGRYSRPAATSARRKSPSACSCGSTGARASAQSGAMMLARAGRGSAVEAVATGSTARAGRVRSPRAPSLTGVLGTSAACGEDE
ncbi:hypothetical protein IU11_10795 [Cellulosimicrobium sp. MM]|nr:hypothetical protein IU11_10795 [Cellulosimicrobium sp. MM]